MSGDLEFTEEDMFSHLDRGGEENQAGSSSTQVDPHSAESKNTPAYESLLQRSSQKYEVMPRRRISRSLI